jgi:hypothetical protein
MFTGSLRETIANDLINAPTPVTSTTNAAVSTSVATTADANGHTVFTAAESDTGSLSTVSSTTIATVAYQAGASSTTVRTLSVAASDSNGVKYQMTYGANNGATTVLPEVSGSFSNDASESYLETDPGIPSLDAHGNVQAVSLDREVNPDGSYTQTNGAVASSGAVVNNVSVEAGSFSGTLTLNALTGGRLFTFAAPAAGTISYTYFNGVSHTTTPSSVPDWIPATLSTPSVETDTIAPGSALDASCKPASGYPSTATKVQQILTIADAILGTLETRTTTSYDIPGPGTICTTVADTISTFYDYSAQEGGVPRLFPSNSATIPAESITIAETVSLQSVGLTASSAVRQPQSIAGGLMLPGSVIAAEVTHRARQEARRLTAFRAQGGSK